MCRIVDLRCKEVINVKDGERLGFVSDVELDIVTGKVVAIVVPGKGKFLGLFGGCDDYVIRWECIERIGEDIILVSYRVPDRECRDKKRPRSRF